MTSKSTRGPLFAEVHNVPDDYHFTAEELDRIIAGDLFTPRQGAIMARELQERRKAERDSEPVAWIVHARTGDQLTTDGGYVANAEGILGLHSTPLYRHAQPAPAVPGKWIPVSEQMPEDRTQVILWDAEIGEVTSGHYSHKTHTFYHCGDAIENEITHWMPPPCAPQEVNRE